MIICSVSDLIGSDPQKLLSVCSTAQCNHQQINDPTAPRNTLRTTTHQPRETHWEQQHTPTLEMSLLVNVWWFCIDYVCKRNIIFHSTGCKTLPFLAPDCIWSRGVLPECHVTQWELRNTTVLLCCLDHNKQFCVRSPRSDIYPYASPIKLYRSFANITNIRHNN